MMSQLFPPVVVFHRTFVAKNSVFGSAGWNSSGMVRRMRYLPERSASGAMFCDLPASSGRTASRGRQR